MATATDAPYTFTLDSGAPVCDNQFSLTAGPRGPTLVDPVLFEKSAAFNRERIPERVVHAKGSGAFGTFTCTKDITNLTKAKVFSQVGKKTPIMMRFSTVGGEKGSSDSVRDVRGFALKMYTEEGNWDITGNNTPVFFLRDPMKFMDMNRSHKKDPRTNLPSPISFWDFFSLVPESMHNLTVLMSDRGTPYGFRHMHGFGLHTFSMINSKNERVYVKFHFKTKQGIKNFTRQEAMQMAGKDPDFATRDLWENIDKKNFPKWCFCIQVMTEQQAEKEKWAFDVTKTWPYKDYPLIEIGELELNQNATNYFAEIEQAAFSPAHVVPGISFSPDKVLQGRIVAYADAHRYRVGANYQYIPVNRPKCPFHSYSFDGQMQMKVEPNFPNYEPNSYGGPKPDPKYKDLPMKVSGTADRHVPEDTDDDYYLQPRLLFNLMKPDAQERLCENVADHMQGVPDKIIQTMLVHYRKTDQKYHDMIVKNLSKLKKEKEMEAQAL